MRAVSLLIALYLLLVIALPLALSLTVSYRTLPDQRSCPICGNETLHVLSRWLRFVSAFTRNSTLERHWCTACGWEGVVRIRARRPARNPLGPEPLPSGALNAVDLRFLEVDGRAWRVLLQCWCDAERWYGRLLFVDPTGRFLVDSGEPLHGLSQHDVIRQALALSDRILTCRLREVTSD